MSAAKDHELPPAPPPTRTDLFMAFLKITLSSIGVPLPWTRRMFVDTKRWMTADEFNRAFALCQFLPGPSIVNLAVVFGTRMHGATGALAAWAGFLVAPFCIMVAAAVLYERYGDIDAVRRCLDGIAPAVAGLILATAAKMAAPVFKGGGPGPYVLGMTMVAVVWMPWSLLAVLGVLVPVSTGLAWWWMRR